MFTTFCVRWQLGIIVMNNILGIFFAKDMNFNVYMLLLIDYIYEY